MNNVMSNQGFANCDSSSSHN